VNRKPLLLNECFPFKMRGTGDAQQTTTNNHTYFLLI
jgi:hypothetical protein